MALAFLVSCLISVASFHDWMWKVFMTNSALNYSDVLSFLLPPCPLVPGLQAIAPCPPSVPHGASATGMASLCAPKESIPKCLSTAFFTQVDYSWRALIPVIEQWPQPLISVQGGHGDTARHNCTTQQLVQTTASSAGHQVQCLEGLHLIVPSLFHSFLKEVLGCSRENTLPFFSKSSPLKWQKLFQWWVRPRREN